MRLKYITWNSTLCLKLQGHIDARDGNDGDGAGAPGAIEPHQLRSTDMSCSIVYTITIQQTHFGEVFNLTCDHIFTEPF